MKLFADKSFEKLTLLSVAFYIFMLAVCAKGVYLYANQHPSEEELLVVTGIVRDVRLGGDGSATRLKVESEHGTRRYSSYYGIVWPGMERIRPGDRVELLAERNRLNKNELIEGKSYYIWGLVHQQQRLIHYADVRELVQGKEATINRYINRWLAASLLFLAAAGVRKMIMSSK